jgi:predicted ester cyclase
MTSVDQAIELVRRYTEVVKTRNLDELDAIFTSDFSNHTASSTEQGIDMLKDFLSMVWGLVPDVEATINTIFADKVDDGEPWVGALVTLRGTRADNSQTIEFREVWIFRISEGKIAERRYVIDRAALSASFA